MVVGVDDAFEYDVLLDEDTAARASAAALDPKLLV